ncbi:multidrug efflux SMR transporter [Microbacterium sp. UBA3486]|uniref:DMT family transporter n=1 Tax=Microbacterium TaxID=33882 RepID=UPI002600744D|nr:MULTISPECIES: SMR family transporter [Microbacterium]
MNAGILTVVPGRALRAKTPSLPRAVHERHSTTDRPRPSAWPPLLIAIALEVSATLSLRAAEGFTHPLWLIVVVIGYTGSLGLLSVALDRGMAIGVVLIAAGVAMIEFGGAH